MTVKNTIFVYMFVAIMSLSSYSCEEVTSQSFDRMNGQSVEMTHIEDNKKDLTYDLKKALKKDLKKIVKKGFLGFAKDWIPGFSTGMSVNKTINIITSEKPVEKICNMGALKLGKMVVEAIPCGKQVMKGYSIAKTAHKYGSIFGSMFSSYMNVDIESDLGACLEY